MEWEVFSEPISFGFEIVEQNKNAESMSFDDYRNRVLEALKKTNTFTSFAEQGEQICEFVMTLEQMRLTCLDHIYKFKKNGDKRKMMNAMLSSVTEAINSMEVKYGFLFITHYKNKEITFRNINRQLDVNK